MAGPAPRWPTVTDANDAIARALNTRPKYVAATTPVDRRWQHTTVLGPDVPAAVASLKRRHHGPILVLGSSALVHSLTEHALADDYQLWLHPVVLGSGKRLFREAARPSRSRWWTAGRPPAGW